MPKQQFRNYGQLSHWRLRQKANFEAGLQT
jgi:hypothetical protein